MATENVDKAAGFLQSVLGIYTSRLPHGAAGWARLFSTLLDIVLIFLLAWALVLLAKWISGLVISGMALTRGEKFEHRARTLQSLGVSVLKCTIFFIAAGAVLTRLGLNWRPLFAVAAVVGLAVAFGAKGLMQDLVTGLSLLLENQFGIGDYVEISGKAGRVEEMTLRVVKVRDAAGCLHTLPNREISTVSNYTAGHVSVVVDIFLRSGADAKKAGSVVAAACDRCSDLPFFIGRPKVKGVRHRGTPDAHVRVEALAVPGGEGLAEAELSAALRAVLIAAGEAAPDGRVRSFQESDLFTPPAPPASPGRRPRGGVFRRKMPEPPSREDEA